MACVDIYRREGAALPDQNLLKASSQNAAFHGGMVIANDIGAVLYRVEPVPVHLHPVAISILSSQN